MDEKIARIQARLRAQLSQPVATPQALKGRTVMGFEVVSGVPNGGENLVCDVIAELKTRGHRVAHIMRYGVNSVPSAFRTDPAQAAYLSDARLVVTPERTVLTREVATEPDLASLLDQVGDGYDLAICEGFEYQPIPKVMITRKVQEAFNLGLPNIVAYVSCKDAGAQIPRFSPVEVPELVDFIERRIMGIEPTRRGAAPASVPQCSGAAGQLDAAVRSDAAGQVENDAPAETMGRLA